MRALALAGLVGALCVLKLPVGAAVGAVVLGWCLGERMAERQVRG
jgi:hypothetical protein